MRAGVIALQGGFNAHIEALNFFGIKAIEIKAASQINQIELLVFPGGESTTMLKLLDENLEKAIISYASSGKKIFATCAGLILLSEEVLDPTQKSLKQIPIAVSRNAYGRQINSFIESSIKTHNNLEKISPYISGTFIRAPKITKILSNDVEVLATVNDDPVCIKYKNIIASTFHPELEPKSSKPLYDLILS